MKNFKRLEFSPSKLNHEEMKKIKAGNSGSAYSCSLNTGTSGSGGVLYTCSTSSGVCIIEGSRMGRCVITGSYDLNTYTNTIGCKCE